MLSIKMRPLSESDNDSILSGKSNRNNREREINFTKQKSKKRKTLTRSSKTELSSKVLKSRIKNASDTVRPYKRPKLNFSHKLTNNTLSTNQSVSSSTRVDLLNFLLSTGNSRKNIPAFERIMTQHVTETLPKGLFMEFGNNNFMEKLQELDDVELPRRSEENGNGDDLSRPNLDLPIDSMHANKDLPEPSSSLLDNEMVDYEAMPLPPPMSDSSVDNTVISRKSMDVSDVCTTIILFVFI